MFYEADAPLPPSSVKGRKTGNTIIISIKYLCIYDSRGGVPRVSVKSGSVR